MRCEESAVEHSAHRRQRLQRIQLSKQLISKKNDHDGLMPPVMTKESAFWSACSSRKTQRTHFCPAASTWSSFQGQPDPLHSSRWPKPHTLCRIHHGAASPTQVPPGLAVFRGPLKATAVASRRPTRVADRGLARQGAVARDGAVRLPTARAVTQVVGCARG